jgi:hypothetical protein
MSIYPEFKPTYLYIKQHSITGLKYLGKTTKTDPDAYLGSGTYWRRHIKAHGVEHVVTLWKQLFTDREELIQEALRLSEEHDVANSEGWANLQEENGLDGVTIGTKLSKEHRDKLAAAHRGKKFTEEHKTNMSRVRMGKTASPETKQKISARLRINNPSHNPEIRAKIAASLRGKPRPDLAERNRIRWENWRLLRSQKDQTENTSA